MIARVAPIALKVIAIAALGSSAAVAQQTIQVVSPPPYFLGTAPSYEAQCEIVMTDHSRQSVVLRAQGTGSERQVTIEIENNEISARNDIRGGPADSSGRAFVSEGFIYTPRGDERDIYLLQYSIPLEDTVLTVGLRHYAGRNAPGRLAGSGLCWIKGIEQ